MALDRGDAFRELIVVMNVLRLHDRLVVRDDLEEHLPRPCDRPHVALAVFERLIGRIHRGPGAFAVLVDEREFKDLEAGAVHLEARKQGVHMEQVPTFAPGSS